jgi:hypothetical protein
LAVDSWLLANHVFLQDANASRGDAIRVFPYGAAAGLRHPEHMMNLVNG